MPEIQVPDIARKLARRFQIDGPSPAPTLAPEIVPVAIVSDLARELEEDATYMRAATVFTTVAAGVGQVSLVQLWNPASTGILVVPELIICATDAAETIRVAHYDTALSTAVTPYWRDRRIAGRPAAHVYGELGADVGTIVAGASVTASNEAVTIPLDMVLEGDQGIVIKPGSVNHSLIISLYWQERSLVPGE